MALTKITNSLVAINAIQGTLIADNAVTAVHIVNNAITATQLADNAVTATKIQNGIIAADHLAADLITATKIADDAISEEHLDVTVISSLSTVTANSSDYVMLGDTSDSNNLKKALVSDLGNSLANDANNRVITGTGSGLNGEANLTFDGSTLAVTGAATVSTTLGVTGAATFNEDVTITKSSGDVTLLLYASENSGSREPALQLKGYSTNSNPIIQFGDNAGLPGAIEYENQDNSMMFHTNGTVALTLSSAQLATFAGALTVTGVTTIANTSAANVNNDSHILIRNVANGNIVTDALLYNSANNQLIAGNGDIFIQSQLVRSGANDLRLGTASQNPTITISNTTGSVGFGTTSPSTNVSRQLHVNAAGMGSGIHFTDSTTGSANSDGWGIHTYNGYAYLWHRETDAMIFATGNTEHFRIANGGSLTATDTSIGSNSDSRLKKNIESYTYDISKFKSYSPKKFDWINPEQHGDRSQQIGFIAQEQEIIDERFIGSIVVDSVAGVEDNPDVSLVDEDRIIKTSKFGQMDAMYISVIQQLITRLETAEAKIVTLEG